MEENVKGKFINSIKIQLDTKVSNECLNDMLCVIINELNKYELMERCTAIVPKETDTSKIIKLFLATKKLEGRSDESLRIYACNLKMLLDTVQLPIKEIGLYDIRGYLAGKKLNGCSDSTLGTYRSVLCSFFNWAYHEGLIPNNPCENLGVIKCKKEIKTPFTKVELEIIRENCTRVRDRAIVETLLATGCRISELCGMNISDVNFDAQEIKVLGKGNKERIVYIDSVTVMWLKKYLGTRTNTGEELFSAQGRGRIKSDTVRAVFKCIEEKSGIENIHPHRFRRTLATTLIDRGMSLQEVAKILGHENINTTMTYVYLDDKKTKAAYNKYTS